MLPTDPDAPGSQWRQTRFEAWCRTQGLLDAVNGWELVAAGWESEIWGFTLGDRRLVLREYHGADGPTKAEVESRALLALTRAGYPVPEVIALETDPRHLGRPFIVMERIDGPLLADRPGWGAAELGRLQARLHALDPRDLLAHGVMGHLDPPRQVAGLLGEWRAVIASTRLAGFDAAIDFAAAAARNVPPGRPGLVHWDLHPWNVIDAPVAGPVVIDWTAATINDVRLDLAASMILWISNRLPEAGAIHLEAYRAAAGEPVEQLEFFEALAAIRRLVSGVVSLRLGPEALGMRSAAAAAVSAHLPGLAAVYQRWREVGGPAVALVDEVIGG